MIILTKQQKQTNDITISSILKKTRKKILKFVDVKKLNTHVMTNLNDCNSKL